MNPLKSFGNGRIIHDFLPAHRQIVKRLIG